MRDFERLDVIKLDAVKWNEITMWFKINELLFDYVPEVLSKGVIDTVFASIYFEVNGDVLSIEYTNKIDHYVKKDHITKNYKFDEFTKPQKTTFNAREMFDDRENFEVKFNKEKEKNISTALEIRKKFNNHFEQKLEIKEEELIEQTIMIGADKGYLIGVEVLAILCYIAQCNQRIIRKKSTRKLTKHEQKQIQVNPQYRNNIEIKDYKYVYVLDKDIKTPLKDKLIKYERHIDRWGVRGHFRQYKSGKKGFIKAYEKGSGRERKQKNYII